jgi:uncharacterized protein YjbJ (UPF0337 family)
MIREVFIAAVLAGGLAACERQGPAERAGEAIDSEREEAQDGFVNPLDGDAERAGAEIDQAVGKTGEAVEKAAGEAGAAVERAGDEVEREVR